MKNVKQKPLHTKQCVFWQKFHIFLTQTEGRLLLHAISSQHLEPVRSKSKNQQSTTQIKTWDNPFDFYLLSLKIIYTFINHVKCCVLVYRYDWFADSAGCAWNYWALLGTSLNTRKAFHQSITRPCSRWEKSCIDQIVKLSHCPSRWANIDASPDHIYFIC